MSILLGLFLLILWYIAKFKRKTIMFLTNRTILDKCKFFNSISLPYLIAGLALIFIGLVDLSEVVSNHQLINNTERIILIVFAIMNSWAYFKYTDPKPSK